jgi:hypothetical protein
MINERFGAGDNMKTKPKVKAKSPEGKASFIIQPYLSGNSVENRLILRVHIPRFKRDPAQYICRSAVWRYTQMYPKAWAKFLKECGKEYSISFSIGGFPALRRRSRKADLEGDK